MNGRYRVKPAAAKTPRGRKTTKKTGILFKFKPDRESFLRNQSDKDGQTMVRFIEDLLDFRALCKTWPPVLK